MVIDLKKQLTCSWKRSGPHTHTHSRSINNIMYILPNKIHNLYSFILRDALLGGTYSILVITSSIFLYLFTNAHSLYLYYIFPQMSGCSLFSMLFQPSDLWGTETYIIQCTQYRKSGFADSSTSPQTRLCIPSFAFLNFETLQPSTTL